MKYNNSRDCSINSRFWIWLASRMKPGQKCIHWQYWRCRWEIETIKGRVSFFGSYSDDSWEFINKSGYSTGDFHRIRPMWFRFISPSYWLFHESKKDVFDRTGRWEK